MGYAGILGAFFLIFWASMAAVSGQTLKEPARGVYHLLLSELEVALGHLARRLGKNPL